MTETKRGSNGGNARKEKLPEDVRKKIASDAAKQRWAEVRRKKEEKQLAESVPDALPIEIPAPELTPIHGEPQEKHCPACMNGESLEEGEGTHILATVEHPVVLPAAFQDAEASVALPEPHAAPQKTPKRPNKAIPKEFKSAGSYAEKRVLQANKERAVHAGEIAKHQAKIKELDAEINGLLPIIKALGGTVDPQAPMQPAHQAPYTPPQLPPPYPEYAQPQSVLPIVTPPKPMHAGGAGVAQGMLEVPTHWYEG